ncbi:NUDIX hydrolase [Mesorhizobium helmanticense]|uniref:NUDIX hydrolase n=1 Tax=Mesorhizobium helmanticense TaxID=1776423 RepID=A0A2T4J371_9HYPH|nr:NUDIX hydrolase [Mesorhizobium helmanticense]PTE12349.1 NUDIX hydrolase [Mesorhizobium helmanticense]
MLTRLTTHNHLATRVRRLFGTAPCRLQVAALPWRDIGPSVEIMLITSRDTGRWVLPKGWPEAKEPLCEAAAREAGEEAGLRGTISHIEVGRYFYAKALASGEEVPCEVLVFPLQVDKIADRWKEKRARTRKWVTSTEAVHMVNEPDLCEIIADFCSNPRGSS